MSKTRDKKAEERWIDEFRVTYEMLGRPPQKKFNHSIGNNGWGPTWVKRTGSKGWNDLLRRAGFSLCVRSDDNHNCKLQVILNRKNVSLEELEEIEQKLRTVLG